MQGISAFVLLRLWIVTSMVVEISATRLGLPCRELNTFTIITSFCRCAPCHVCEWRDDSCQIIDTADLSDGSELPVDQPSLDSSAWFLTESEMTTSRYGVPRTGLSLNTSNNAVTIYAATNEMFQSLFEEVEQMGSNDLFYMTGWSISEIPLDPLHNLTASSFHSVLNRTVQRGVDYRALLWSNLQERSQVIKFRDFVNKHLPSPSTPSARFVFDDRLMYPTSSHHQKTILLRHQQKLVAYVGGIDLTMDRWDTILHNQKSLRRQANIRQYFDGWLDAHLRIAGPAARDVGNNFLQRWNSKHKQDEGDISDELLDFKNPPYKELPGIDTPDRTGSSGTHHVQITRTYSCKYKKYENAPRGERSLLDARIKAIQQAKNYIYIEDQYFMLVPKLLEALLNALPRIQRVIVVVQRILPELKWSGYEKFMYDMVKPLQKRYPNKFQFYSTKEELNLYIHSKMVLIDDVYVSIGSANWNARSMTSDSELGANVMDSETVVTPDKVTVGKLPHDYRIRKFMEYTGKTYEELKAMTFIEAANALDEAAASPTTILEPYEVDMKPEFIAFTDPMHEFIDPNDMC